MDRKKKSWTEKTAKKNRGPMKVGLGKKSWTEKIVDRKKNRGPIEYCVPTKIVDRINRGPELRFVFHIFFERVFFVFQDKRITCDWEM